MNRRLNEAAVHLANRLERIVTIHNRVRQTCFPDPSSEEGHFANENTVVRMAATMEAIGLGPPSGNGTADMEWPEVAIRTLFLFRNIIVHEPEGYYRPELLGGSKRHLRAYDMFCDMYPQARVSEGEKLCLAGDEVILPLMTGCIVWWWEKQGRQLQTRAQD